MKIADAKSSRCLAQLGILGRTHASSEKLTDRKRKFVYRDPPPYKEGARGGRITNSMVIHTSLNNENMIKTKIYSITLLRDYLNPPCEGGEKPYATIIPLSRQI